MTRRRPTESAAISHAAASRSTPAAQPIKKVFTIKELVQVVGRSRTSIYEDVRRGEFPAPIATGPKSRRWICDEIFAWIEQRAAERDRSVA
jgi:prophage regulatory protein